MKVIRSLSPVAVGILCTIIGVGLTIAVDVLIQRFDHREYNAEGCQLDAHNNPISEPIYSRDDRKPRKITGRNVCVTRNVEQLAIYSLGGGIACGLGILGYKWMK